MVHPVQSVVESLYAAGRCPRLHVNATCEGVVCPDFIREQWQERLIIDLDASYPLDLTFAEDGIGADLSFGGYVTRCTFPWKAIYVVADRATGRGIVLDQNMPESVRRSRTTPTTGPLPTGGDLREVFEAKDNRVGVPGRRNRRKPQQKQSTGPSLSNRSSRPGDRADTSLPNTSLSGSGSSQPATEANSERDEEVQRRRAAFKVIDGGS
jgi:stringent starvation protein B